MLLLVLTALQALAFFSLQLQLLAIPTILLPVSSTSQVWLAPGPMLPLQFQLLSLVPPLA